MTTRKSILTFGKHSRIQHWTQSLMKYKVEIEELLRRVIEIEADSESDAEMKVLELYRNFDIVLDADDFIDEPNIQCIK